MSRLFSAYRAFHEQGFVPIFVDDPFDSRGLVEASLAAGAKGIEYTLRRRDAHKMIPWIREHYPDLFLLVGSTIEDDDILLNARKRHPQLLTIAELNDMGVDGFVSMIGWSPETISKYSATRLIIPAAATVNEAFFQVKAGAHFVKLLGPDIDLVKKCRHDASFDYCPILVTGGMTPERLPDAIAAGAVIIGSGFDLILKGLPADVGVDQVTQRLVCYLDAVRHARAQKWPELERMTGTDGNTWLDCLPHYHPFRTEVDSADQTPAYPER